MAERKVRIGNLDRLSGVLAEMGKLYRCARREEIDTLDASRLVSMLAEMRRVLEVADIEPRLRALEASASGDVISLHGRRSA
ncbi:MAG: hypothetical protein O3C49_05710 [Proteobacteria bacterium]|nr:hypothetical protein [Pseudomonadota bacterium]